jgi:hypothetical protein
LGIINASLFIFGVAAIVVKDAIQITTEKIDELVPNFM